jgi:small subunit ribosomal protein S1
MGDREAQKSETQQFRQEELQEEFLKSLDELEVGQLIEGTVVQIGPEHVFVDIGYKSEGRISVTEFDELPEIGTNLEVVLLSKETKGAGVPVSKKKAEQRMFWKELKQALQDRQPVEGTVTRSVKGGFEVQLAQGVRAFNPISKMDMRRVTNPDEYINLTSKFYIERLYSDNRVNIVVSRRDWLEDEVEGNRNAFFENTEIGDTVEGTVKSFTSFGAFVDLGGFDGLLHINDMSWGHVTRPKDHVSKGEKLQLKVIRMDPEEKKINLSLRHMTEDPWNTFEDKYQVDDVVTGKVTKLADFGAFIELEEGIEGLAHISELSWTKHVNHPQEIVQVGEEVQVKILEYDIQKGRVSLGIKQVHPNPWDEVPYKFPEGSRIRGEVKKLTNSGAFVELEEGIDGFLPVEDISWTRRYKHPSAALSEGEEVDCVVTSVDPETNNVRVGIKQLSEDPWTALKRAYSKRSIIEGEITNITDFGVFVQVEGGVEGLINKSNLADPEVESFESAVERLEVGQRIRAVITELNPQRQRLSLSVRELERETQRQEMEKYIHDEAEETTLTLGELLKEKEKT